MRTDPIFQEAPPSLDEPLEVLAGEVPSELRGLFLRNGPGAFRIGHDELHFLDGHGFLAAVRFEPGQAPRLAASLAPTPLRTAELAAGRQTARRVFTNLPRRWANLFNVKLGNGAAHDAYLWGGDVNITDNPGHFSLDANSLALKGPAPPSRLLRGPTGNVSPMPRYDPATDRIVLYDMKPGVLGSDELAFHELDRQWSPVRRVARKLPGKGIILHDLAFSQRYYLAIESGRLNVGALVAGGAAPYEAISFSPTDPLRVFALPREGDGPVKVARLPAGHQAFHLFNAFDDGEDKLVFDACTYGARVDFRALNPEGLRGRVPPPAPVEAPTPTRFVLDLGTGEVSATPVGELTGDAPDVNPAFHGRRHRYGYLAARTSRGAEPEPNSYLWAHGLAKVYFEENRSEAWDGGPSVICSAPAFAARPGGTDEDDGWILSWLTDVEEGRSDVGVFDARHLAKGPIARLKGPAHLPGVSHTAFWPTEA